MRHHTVGEFDFRSTPGGPDAKQRDQEKKILRRGQRRSSSGLDSTDNEADFDVADRAQSVRPEHTYSKNAVAYVGFSGLRTIGVRTWGMSDTELRTVDRCMVCVSVARTSN